MAMVNTSSPFSPGFNVFALTFATVQPQLGFGFCNCSTASRCSDT